MQPAGRMFETPELRYGLTIFDWKSNNRTRENRITKYFKWNRSYFFPGEVISESVPGNLADDTRLNYEQNLADAMCIMPKLQTGDNLFMASESS